MITLRFVDSCRDIPVALWDACFPAPHEGLWWYRSLEASGLGDQFSFFYGVLEVVDAQGKAAPVGIAPCFLADVPMKLVVPEAVLLLLSLPTRLFPSLGYQRTLFVGSPCADEGRIGTLPEVDRPTAVQAVYDAVLAEARRRGAPMLVWKDIPGREKALLDGLGQQRPLFSLPSYPNTLVRFGSQSKADYFAALKGSRRHQLKKKLKLSAERVQVDTEVLQRPSVAVLDEVFALFMQTFARSPVQFERLNRRTFALLAEAPPVHFILLRERSSGDLIAFMMCFAIGDLVINKYIGFDYDRPREWLLYFRLWEAALEWSLARGAVAIQSGQTCYAPKIEQGHRLMPLYNYGRHLNPLMHWIYKKVASTITWQSLDDDLARFLKAHPEENLEHPEC
ncbi:hypothetical protein AZSI13_32860 [Azospira sp. I13]|uniref:GNAT family N-acetyltransferase n=1 Tax=Azospira sp. I13 TaxID=1765050 RepID=UPI000D447393|nr:GNAT family N-acetyltransferase [Azospira sp. I13]GBG03959.1 hypothetical protein AZSI13_32860 [Azospira sp. I13]